MIDYEVYTFTKREKWLNYSGAILLLFFVSYLFYKNLIISLLFLGFLPKVIKYRKKQLIQRRYRQINMEFKEGMLSINAALAAGYSIENAIVQALNDLHLLLSDDSYLIKEFEYMVYELQINKTVEEIFTEFAQRIPLEDVKNFTDVFATAKRTGGNLIKIINATTHTISSKMEVKREIQTMVTAKEFEANIMCMMPLGIIVYMWLGSPGFMDCLYNNLIGFIIMTVLLLGYVGAYLLVRKIMNIQV